MTKEELKEKIEAYEEIINDPTEDQTTRDFAAKKVAKLKDQMAPDPRDTGEEKEWDDKSDEQQAKEIAEYEAEEVEEVEEVEEEKPKAKKTAKKTTKKKGRGRPKKRGRPAKRKSTKKAAPTKAKVKKMSKDLGLSVKECEELLEKYNNEDKARKSRLAKRKKAGKTAELSVSESLEKEVKTVKNKVEDKKTPTTKAQAKSQGSKITDLVKAILEGIDKKKDKITQIDAIIKGLVAEKKKIMAKKGTGAFLVGSALGGYAGYKIGLSKDKTALKDLFKGEKKLAKDFKDAVKDKKKKDETYTEFEEIYAKGGKIDRDEPIVEFMINTGDREHLSLFRPRKFSSLPLTVEDVKKMKEEEIVDMMYGGDAEMTDYGVDIGDSYVRVDNIMTMGEYIDRGYAKGGYTANVEEASFKIDKWLMIDERDEETMNVWFDAIDDGDHEQIKIMIEDFGDDERLSFYGIKSDKDVEELSKYLVDSSYAKGGKTQGYDDTEDESLGMRTGKEISKKQSMKARREDSYGKWGKRDKERVSKKMLEKAAKETGAPMEALKDYAKAKGLTDKNLVEKASSHYIGTYNSDEEMVEENDLYHHLDDNMMVNPKLYGIYGGHSYFTEFSKGGKTPKFKVRKSFYDKTIGANEKTGTGEDMRTVYHLQMDDESGGRWTNLSQNYLIDSKTATEEYLEENRPFGVTKGFEVEEEVYVDYTDKDGNKKKRYLVENSPDSVVRTLRDKYNAVSIEDITMDWEMEDKGRDYADYSDYDSL